MAFISYAGQFKSAMDNAKKEACNQVGLMMQSEYQSRTPVRSGNMREHEAFDVHDDNNGVDIGTTPEADYALYVEEGSSKQRAQHILENSIMENISNITKTFESVISSKLGD